MIKEYLSAFIDVWYLSDWCWILFALSVSNYATPARIEIGVVIVLCVPALAIMTSGMSHKSQSSSEE